MICKRCFRMSDDDLEYCPYCGKSFTDDSEINVNEKKDETDENKKDTEHKNEPEREPINLFSDSYTSPPPFTPPSYREPAVAEKTPLQKLFSSLWHAILYLVLFLLVQNLVASAFSTAIMVKATAEYMTEYYTSSGTDFGAMSDEEYNAMMNKLTEELNVVMLEAMENVDFNLLSAVASAATVLALLITAKIKRRSFSEHTNFHLSPLKRPRVYLVIPAAIALQFVIIFILNIIPFSEETLKSYEELYSFVGDSPLFIELLSVVIGAPIVEELIFRGCIHSRLRRSMNPLTSALISSFLFGIAHGHIIAASYAFVLGLVLSYLYEKYDSVVIPILFHAAFNASNYLPLATENSTDTEILITVGVSLVIFAICAAIVVTDKNKEKKAKNDNIEGI